MDAAEPQKKRIVCWLKCEGLPVSTRYLNMLSQDPIVFRMRLEQLRPLAFADQQFGLRDLGDPTHMIEMQMGHDRQVHIACVKTRFCQNPIEPVTFRDVKLEDAPQKNRPTALEM